ncbi:MAG: hypothetical protein ACTSU6_05625 [Candidatus Njordarchaeales archaeon]
MVRSVTPGIHPMVELYSLTEEQRKIVNRLSKEWFITNSGENINLGKTSQYHYILMRAPDNYREMFNLQQDIIVVFSPYDSFETRTVDALDYVYQKLPRLRVERICGVIISKDENIENRLEELYKNEPESLNIVPFTYKELLNPIEPYFLRNRFKKYFYTRDLFAFEGPLKKDLFFFGRRGTVNNIVNRHLSGENSSLFGLRKTGKTSVIFGIERALNHIGGNSLVIDCQNPSFHKRRWNNTLFYIISQLCEKYKSDLIIKKESKYTEENAALIFERDLLNLYEVLGKKKILFIFDEIENITCQASPSDHWTSELDFVLFWQTLRAIYQKHDNLFTYLIVGTNPTCIELSRINGKDNPIFNQVSFDYIKGFDVPQVREMVRKLGRIMGLKFQELIYSKLTDDFGGHPYLIRHVCSIINKLSPSERPVEIGKAIYKKASEIFTQEYSSYIEMILEILRSYYRDEYTMLRCLAIGDSKSFYQIAGKYPSYTAHLIGYGILEYINGDYCFKMESVKEYLSKKHRFEKTDSSQKEMLLEISERRNMLEPTLRKIIRQLLLAGYGEAQARDEFLQVMDEKRRGELANLTYAELFNANKAKIYFDDLKKIVLKHWVIFKNILNLNKAEFEKSMNFINAHREDAHAKEITQGEMAYYRICITKIEESVNQYLD